MFWPQILARHDDIIEQTQRVKPLLKADAQYVDLPDLKLDLFNSSVDRMLILMNRYLPA
jgi:hypothetical protein